MVRFENVTKKFGKNTALSRISFEVNQGDVLGILGPNGSGKTTLINLLLGLLNPTKGQIFVDNFDVQFNRDKIHKYIGALLETPRLYPTLSAFQNLEVFCKLLNVARGRIDELLNLVELKHARDQAFNTFSLGMKQRLTIALALLNDPEILVFDEPTNGLDPEGIIDIRNLILKLAKTQKTIILCSHLISEVQQICKKVIILKDGNIISVNTIDEIKNAGSLYRLKYSDIDRLKQKLNEQQRVNVLHKMKPGFLDTDETRTPDYLFVQLNDGYTSQELNEFLASENIYLEELTKRLNSLEDYFLHVLQGTGRGRRATD
jgi:ABC-2 type transport system ATP-binding protein